MDVLKRGWGGVRVGVVAAMMIACLLAAPGVAFAEQWVASGVVYGNAPGSWLLGSQGYTPVRFTVTTSSYATNVRSGPGTGYSVVRSIPPKTAITCYGWRHGSTVTDLWTGGADQRWYRIDAPASASAPTPAPSGDRFGFPLPNSSTQSQYPGYGIYNWYYQGKYHTGTDSGRSHGAPAGTAVNATADGVVKSAGWASGWGWTVVIEHASPEGTVHSQYAHLRDRPLVGSGARVARGQRIGYVGGTPNWAPHLHFEIKRPSAGGSLLGPGYTTAHPNTYGYKDPYAFIRAY